MPRIVLARETDWDGWRTATRAHVLSGTPPETITWSIGADKLSAGDPLPDGTGSFGVPRALVALAAQAIQARDPDRFDLLYRLVWRAQAGEPVLEQRDDPELARARRLALAVRAEAHRMRTHLRFLPLQDTNPTLHLGWDAPAHSVLEANAQLLAQRFAGLHFAILTPDTSAHWDGAELRFGPGLDPALVPDDNALAAQWHDYGPDILAGARVGTAVPTRRGARRRPAPARPPADRNRRAARAARQGAGRRHRRRQHLSPLPARRPRHADRVRRRPRRRAPAVHRRAARRPGRHHRPPLRRPRRPGAGPRVGGSRHRPPHHLHHQRGQTFQIHPPAPAASTKRRRPRKSRCAASGWMWNASSYARASPS